MECSAPQVTPTEAKQRHTWMDRRSSGSRQSQRRYQHRTELRVDEVPENLYQDYASRRVERPTIRQVPSSRRGSIRPTKHSTETSISDPKLKTLSQQLVHPSKGTYEQSVDLYVEKPRSRPVSGRRDSRRRSSHQKDQIRRNYTQSDRHTTRKSIARRDLTDDFYYREKGHERVTSGQPLVNPRQANGHYRSSKQNRSQRSRRYEAEKCTHTPTQKWKRWLLAAVATLVLLALIIGVAVGVTEHKRHYRSSPPPASNSSLTTISPESIPLYAKGTYLDPFTWYDTADFNLTFTNDTIGDLPIMGLHTSFSNSVRANPTVPPLSEIWPYSSRPVRGINIGGWLSLEPFITPSLFNTTAPANAAFQPPYPDEWTLSTAIGPAEANALLDKHYSQFANASTFAAIRAAGFDHVRIPFPYWAVQTYQGDPYVPHTVWRYLLRGIEYARQNGLRVNLDLHSAPGSQNGWNHSGKVGPINWLNGTAGMLNAERTLEIHTRLATFFSQNRYKGLITLYGLLNEPRMIFIDRDAVVNWTATAIRQLRASPLPNDTVLVFSDGFESLPYWHTAFSSEAYADIIPPGSNASAQRLLLDSHEYVIFNRDQLLLNHTAKLDFACTGWSQQVQQSMNPDTGFGSFLCGEWSQADTDCAAHLNPEGAGNRWEGMLRTANISTSVLVPSCPLVNTGRGNDCKCGSANADPRAYSDGYKTWLRRFADAQLRSFGQGWGSFYWTWDVEDGVEGGAQWSWRKGVEAGILPGNVAEGGDALWDCGGGEVDWSDLGLDESY